MAVKTTHYKQVRSKMKQTNQLTNLFFPSFSPSLSPFRSLDQMQRSDKQPPMLPPTWCVCSVAISKSIPCHFSFLLTQSYSPHIVQGDKARSVVWPNKFCTLFVEYSPSTLSTWCIELSEVQLHGIMVMDGDVV